MCAMPLVRRCEARRFTAAAILALVVGLLAGPCLALDKVSLQLRWINQFEFAGYYAALEQGFYKDAGLDVDIREGGPEIDALKEVQEGKADFGICTTNVLLAKGAPVVVLAVIFQHSPAILLVPSRARITSLRDLKGHPLMDAPGTADIAAMLQREGVDYASLPRVTHYGNPRDLIDDKADAMVAYSTNEPFVLGDELDQSRTHPPPRSVDSDRQSLLAHDHRLLSCESVSE